MIVNKYSNGGGGGSYTLPTATASRLGGVKIGNGVNVANDGKISVDSYTLPAATDNTLGGVKVGSGVNVDTAGTISVNAYTLPAATSEVLGGVKIGSGVNVDTAGTISVNAYTLPAASSEVLGGVKIGSGLTVDSAGTISVSGGTSGGGIEKVNALPQSAEEGDVVWLNGETKTGYTILCAESDGGWPWELDREVISVNGSTDGYLFRLGDIFVPGRWSGMFLNLLMRVRLNENDYPILDVIDLTGENTIAPGPDAVSMESGVTFPMKGCLYVYDGGMWKAKPEFEWEYNATEAPAIVNKIYKGIEEFGIDDFVIRYKVGGRYPAREFKCYSGAHYGLDFKCSDCKI